MVEESGVPLWKIMIVSAATAAVSTLGLYYMEHPEKLSNTKKYVLNKLGYSADNMKKMRSGDLSEEDLDKIVEQQVYRAMKKYLPNI